MPKILVVDDSTMTRTVIRKSLATFGVTDVVEAENGQVALEAFQANAPDVVFSDWNMPQMNGLQLLQEIRKLNQKVPVIMVTTEGSREKVMSAISQGVTDYLIKPFTPTTLRDKLSKWVAS